MTGTTEIKQLTHSDYSTLERKKWIMKEYLKGKYPALVRQEYFDMFGLSKSSYDHDVVWVNNQLRKKGERELEEVINTHLDYLYDMYEEARESGQLGVAQKILKEVRETIGLTPNKTKSLVQNNTQTNNINLPAMSVDEIKQLLNIPVSNSVTKDIDGIEVTGSNDDNSSE